MGKKLLVTVICTILCAGLSGCKKSVDTSAGTDGSSGLASDNGSPSVGERVANGWNDALSTGSQTVEDTGEWLSTLYKSARDTGATSAHSVKEWATEDWNARGDWEYRIVELARDDVATVETTLNEAGKARWECYHVDPSGENWTFFLKRSKRSYLSQVPLRDLANILPGLGADGE